MKEILDKYLEIYPNEVNETVQLKDFIDSNNNIFDMSNFKGHITGRGIVYCKSINSILLFFHPELGVWFEPGGHYDPSDKNIYETTLREVVEETGLNNLKYIKASNKNVVPFDIHIHISHKNVKKNIPDHYHYNFRYLFLIDKKEDIKIDNSEISNYKWFNINDLKKEKKYKRMVEKLEVLIK